MRQNIAATDSKISELDIHFANLILRLAKDNSQELFVIIALVSSLTRQGHVCLDLNELTDAAFLQDNLGEGFDSALIMPDVEARLRSASSVVGAPGDFKPLILDQGKRLYLNRYWEYQRRLAAFILSASQQRFTPSDLAALAGRIALYFPPKNAEETDWQRVAAATALLKQLCVITGGPGTGKTFTVARIIALLLEQKADTRILLAAPTGKAAVRLQDAIRAAKSVLPCSGQVREMIPEEAQTIHRLLGYRRHSPYFWHDDENPLEADVLIVDEASMVDLALMSKLVQALLPHTRLILLGDNHQLASVEAGAILADICYPPALDSFTAGFLSILREICQQQIATTPQDSRGIQDSLVLLKKSYRFDTQKGIGAASRAVNEGDAKRTFEVLASSEFPDATWQNLQEASLSQYLTDHFQGYTVRSEPEAMFSHFSRFRILCAVREGPQGVNTINRRIENITRKSLPEDTRRWYAGQPILITENDYQLQLFNGDFGIVLEDSANAGELLVYFPGPENTFRKFRPFRLPPHETAYAMTVHKSQGSEFEHVLLLLPEDDSPILTRELIYTGITRATRQVSIIGEESVFRQAIARRIKRASGLRDALWQENQTS